MKKFRNAVLSLLAVCLIALPALAVEVAPLLRSKEGMVAAANPLAAKVGAEILERGGNAIDAAIAVSFALGVVEPYASGIGGEGFMVVSLADGRKIAVDFRSTAPAVATYENLAATGLQLRDISSTPKGFCIPGVLAAVKMAHELGASLPLKELIAPSVKLAQEGFEVNETFSKVVKDNFDKILKNSPDFLNEEMPWEPGDHFKNPALAETLSLIAENGTDVYYKGELGDNLEKFMVEKDGWTRKSDLESYTAILREVLHGKYRGYDIFVPGNPVGGARLLATLNILENFNLGLMGWDDPLALHIMQEAFILTALDQRYFVGDPAFDKLPEKGFVSKEYARSRMMAIDLSKASDPETWVYRSGDPEPYENGETTYVKAMLDGFKEEAPVPATSSRIKDPVESPSTTHFSIIDKDGNAVAWTQTISAFFGTGNWIDGYFLNNEMGNFKSKFVEGDPINLEPGKRPRTTIAPTIVEKDGKVRWIIGSPGAGRIVSTIVEMIVGLVDFDWSIEETVKAPKFTGYDSYKEIHMEEGYPEESVLFLEKILGHKTKVYSYPDLFFGGPNVIAVEDDGVFIGMGSIRRNGAAAAPSSKK